MREVRMVRFPNESDYQKIEIDFSNFEKVSEFSDEIFGWYGKSIYIAILKEVK